MENTKGGLSRRSILGGASAIVGAAAAGPLSARSTRLTNDLPNIVFIMADDLGYADLGCYGARDIRTPHLDALARSGARLTDGYSNSPVCSATRTALITGNYQYRYQCGLEEPIGLVNIGLPDGEPTLPSLLRTRGYRNALVGKWHLGSMPEFGPLKSGYDRFFGIYEGAAGYFSHNLQIGNVVRGGLVEGETPIERHGYLTDLLADRAIEELEHASKDEVPLFMSLHFTAPHWPWEGPEDESLSSLIANPLHFDGGNLAVYKAMVESMDANIGRVMAKVEELGQTENTIFVFTSDNGGERFSDTWPFVGSKTELLEGGIRVPTLIAWPAQIPAGMVSNQVMMSMDFVPTLWAAAGGESAKTGNLDGDNLLDVLTGSSPVRERTLYWRYKAAEQAAVREGPWKYLSLAGKEYLFNLEEDQRERANLKDREADRLEHMRGIYEAWNATMLPYQDSNYSHSISDHLAERYAPSGTVISMPPDS